MTICAGTILQAASEIDDPQFKNSTLLITEMNDKGAMGFVLNKKFHRSINELEEFSYSEPIPIYEGGPVENEKLFFIHRRPDLISGGTHISGDLYFGGDFARALKMMNDGIISSADLKIFIGYCGWDKGELEAEIAEGSWKIGEANVF